MTLDEFCAITAERIPTPAEFVSFADSQRWRIGVKADGSGSLHADPKDPLAVAFARMLSREPYRTNVIALLRERGPQEDRPAPAPVAKAEPEPKLCPQCNRDVSDPEDRERLRGVNPFCTVGRAKAVTDGNGVSHPANPGCPYRGNGSSTHS